MEASGGDTGSVVLRLSALHSGRYLTGAEHAHPGEAVQLHGVRWSLLGGALWFWVSWKGPTRTFCSYWGTEECLADDHTEVQHSIESAGLTIPGGVLWVARFVWPLGMLHYTSHTSNYSLSGLLLKGLNFPTGKSALHWAAAVNNVEATLVLLKNGANRDMQDNKVQFVSAL